MKLLALVAPPTKPTANAGDWASVERDLGATLPDDWKRIVEAYGYGTFGDFLHLFSPFFTPCPMATQARGILEADGERSKGMLPWAQTDNGDAVYWVVRGDDPNAWPVAVWNARSGKDHEIIEGGAAGFLYRWLSREQAITTFPTDENWPLATFDRWLERTHDTLQIKEAADGVQPPNDWESTMYAWRLERLLESLRTAGYVIESRGGYGDAEDEKRQSHFVADAGDIRFTYDTLYGHNLRLHAPPARMETVKANIMAALPTMGCTAK